MSKTEVQTEPAYVNLQPSTVQVYDENRHPVSVNPWRLRDSHPNGTYVVRGAHYQRFVSGAGPLYPFPADPKNLAPIVAPSSDDLHAREVAKARAATQQHEANVRASNIKIRASGDVVRKGTVVGETQDAFAARLRRSLAQVGIRNPTDFRQAAANLLTTVPGITADNLPRVREMENEIFPPPKPVETTNVALTAVEVAAMLRSAVDVARALANERNERACAIHLVDKDEIVPGTQVDLDSTYVGIAKIVLCWVEPDEDGKPKEPEIIAPLDDAGLQLNTYRLEEIDALDVDGLRTVIATEGFQLKLPKKPSVDVARTALLEALREYNMLIE